MVFWIITKKTKVRVISLSSFKDKDDAQTYIDEYKNSILANGGEVVSESVSYIVQPQMSFTIMDQHTGQVKVIVGAAVKRAATVLLTEPLILCVSRVHQ